jgi:hypothetical protein
LLLSSVKPLNGENTPFKVSNNNASTTNANYNNSSYTLTTPSKEEHQKIELFGLLTKKINKKTEKESSTTTQQQQQQQQTMSSTVNSMNETRERLQERGEKLNRFIFFYFFFL